MGRQRLMTKGCWRGGGARLKDLLVLDEKDLQQRTTRRRTRMEGVMMRRRLKKDLKIHHEHC
jgi:hypothetical protein